MRIAFFGTGLLGTGFIRHLLATTGTVTVWNRTAAKAAPLAEAGARIAASVAEAAAGADRIHLCVKDDAAVDAILAEAVPALPPGAVVIDHTTTSIVGSRARGARLAAAGVGFLHAPVFMSPAAAEKGAGIMMVSGPKALFDRVEAEVATMTGELWFVGEDFRRAAGLKLLGNSMLFSIAAGLADVFAIAAGSGLSPADAMEVLGKLKPAGALEIRGKKMAAGDYSASFELTMARKDMGLMLDAVGDLPLAALRAIAARSDELIAQGHGAADLGVLALGAVPAKLA